MSVNEDCEMDDSRRGIRVGDWIASLKADARELGEAVADFTRRHPSEAQALAGIADDISGRISTAQEELRNFRNGARDLVVALKWAAQLFADLRDGANIDRGELAMRAKDLAEIAMQGRNLFELRGAQVADKAAFPGQVGNGIGPWTDS